MRPVGQVSSRVAVINFAVTPAGVEEQLLGAVVAAERPELDAERGALVMQARAHACVQQRGRVLFHALLRRGPWWNEGKGVLCQRNAAWGWQGRGVYLRDTVKAGDQTLAHRRWQIMPGAYACGCTRHYSTTHLAAVVSPAMLVRSAAGGRGQAQAGGAGRHHPGAAGLGHR